MEPSFAASLARAKERLDRLEYYPEPVRVERVRVVVAPWFFRIPGFRRYAGYALWRTILLKRPDALATWHPPQRWVRIGTTSLTKLTVPAGSGVVIGGLGVVVVGKATVDASGID